MSIRVIILNTLCCCTHIPCHKGVRCIDFHQSRTVERHIVTSPISRSHHLQQNQEEIKQVSDKHESQSGELQQTNGRVSEVEAVDTKHSEEEGERHGDQVAVPLAFTGRGEGDKHITLYYITQREHYNNQYERIC